MEFADPGDYPVIVKPAFEGSSKGIRGRCLVDSAAEAVAAALRLADEYEQPVLVEEFIDGDEVTVGLVGNGARVEVLGRDADRPQGIGGPLRLLAGGEARLGAPGRLRGPCPAPGRGHASG